jgi:PqqD family protein of HPr-rel-A system
VTTNKEDVRWEVPAELAWRVWDEDFFVYNTASGLTHHLNRLAGEALRSLESESAQAHELVRRLANRFAAAEERPSLEMIERLLHDFDELGLIAPSPT